MKKINLMFGTFILTILALALVSAHLENSDQYHGGMGGMMYGSYGYGGMVFGWLVGFLFVVILILFVVWLIKEIQNK